MVVIKDFQQDPSLAQRFQDFREFLESLPSQAAIGDFLVCQNADNNSVVGRTAIVITVSLDKPKVALCLLILVLVVSPLVGIGVGIATHSGGAGVGASGGTVAFGSFLLALIAWVYY